MAPVELPRSVLLVGRISHLDCDQAAQFSCDERALRKAVYRDRPRWLLVGDCPDDAILQALFRSIRPLTLDLKLAVVGPKDDLARFERWLSYGALVYLASGSEPERLAAVMNAADDLDSGVYDRGFLEARQARQHQAASVMGKECALSKREQEVLRLLARGLRNNEIAGELTITLHTVEFHVSHILEKLRARNRTEAVDRARLLGI